MSLYVPLYSDPIPDILLTGTLNLLSGAPNVGKTTITAWLATRLRDATPIFGHRPSRKCWVGYVSCDRPWFISGHRIFENVGFGDIPQYSFLDDFTAKKVAMRNKHERVGVLVGVLKKVNAPEGGVIIVDPLARFLGNNLNDADLVSDCCQELHQYLMVHHLLLIGLMHASKQKADHGQRYSSPFDQMSGSIALQGYANTQMHLMGPDQSKSGGHEFWWQSHHHPMEMFKLRREGPTFLQVDADESGSQPIPEPCQALYAAFPEAPVTLAVPQVFGLFPDTSRPTVFRWLKTLSDLGYLTHTKHGVYQKK